MYEFPKIETIDDVLPAIEGSKEFIVAEREGHKIINYMVSLPDSFPPVMVDGVYNLNAALRRECRGLVFDHRGKILSRRFHKFFNLNEKPETHMENVDFTQDHRILAKLDGSMITPLFLNNKVRWGTKMGLTDVAKPVEEFANSKASYTNFAIFCYNGQLTPIFEWCSRKQRIVLDYPKDDLILTAIRHNVCGDYMSFGIMQKIAKLYDIPVVESFESKVDDITSFRDNLKEEEGIEGVVVLFDDGHKLKIKTDWYLQIHNAKDFMRREWDVATLVLNNQLDDILPLLLEEERVKVAKFASELLTKVEERAKELIRDAEYYYHIYGGSRKAFALAKLENVNYSLVFKLWDDRVYENAFKTITNHFLKHSQKMSTYYEFKELNFSDIKIEIYDEELYENE